MFGPDWRVLSSLSVLSSITCWPLKAVDRELYPNRPYTAIQEYIMQLPSENMAFWIGDCTFPNPIYPNIGARMRGQTGERLHGGNNGCDSDDGDDGGSVRICCPGPAQDLHAGGN